MIAPEPISLAPVGDELVVAQALNRLTLRGRPIVTDVGVMWRIVEGRIAEVWDIPSVFSASTEGATP